MPNRNRRKSCQRSKRRAASPARFSFPVVVGEAGWGFCRDEYRNPVREFAEHNRKRPTAAERRLHGILTGLGDGALRGKFIVQHPISGKWIVDFFFPEIRLAIEVDGSFHLKPEQRDRDREKNADCERFDITLIRITNAEVFGPYRPLVEKLRDGWRKALGRENRIIGRRYEPSS